MWPRELDEYSDQELKDELRRRELERAAYRCDYCHRSYSSHPCKFPTRHAMPKPVQGQGETTT